MVDLLLSFVTFVQLFRLRISSRQEIFLISLAGIFASNNKIELLKLISLYFVKDVLML